MQFGERPEQVASFRILRARFAPDRLGKLAKHLYEFDERLDSALFMLRFGDAPSEESGLGVSRGFLTAGAPCGSAVTNSATGRALHWPKCCPS